MGKTNQTTWKCTLIWIWDNLHHLGWSVSFNEAADHPVTFNKINRSPWVFLIYSKANGPKLKYTTYVPHIEIYHKTPNICFFCISVNFIISVSGKEFFQDCFGHHSVKCHVWEKVYLLSYGSQSYWPSRLHDFSDCSISLTTWLFIFPASMPKFV